ncbi:uncharacterized protein LOC129004327 [Macrosteles quadrilineatus]|uniref:uncharacterized protein LOC129004327 n=1 Tax=Macrosteles quadrilineatus TaxID=74068 RepID=UPI0023E1CA7A|nr:uncharacterized protein LOC129004327 [Macrosteles quadrilineatus]XP_054288847.1 uncharacterized protein LOC129004327 [Macrosteles quadrilineatus]XP_054288848.1 uncharacterized protein LOC129004327 [Macrosteles quadrilineatus]
MIKPCSYNCLARKAHFFSHRRNILHITILILCGFIIFNEFAIYIIKSFTWPEMRCGDIKRLRSLLLVADPQILGEKSEPWFTRWDNDRYLKLSFALAKHHVKPNTIIFLGDLMDEGTAATNEEYQRYYDRFRDIFHLDYIDDNKTVFIPGDNDIGGEDEIVTDKKVARFMEHFASPSVVHVGNVQIVQVNKMQRIVPPLPPLAAGDNMTRVVISHMPLLGVPSAFAAEVLQRLRPHVILSAHDHKSVHFSGDIDTGERRLVENLDINRLSDEPSSSWRFQRSDTLVNEVVVPTCSYRMGVPDMGFGVALVDERGEAWCYHVLWLPSRFWVLWSYVLALMFVVVLLAAGPYCVTYWRSRHRTSPLYKHP